MSWYWALFTVAYHRLLLYTAVNHLSFLPRVYSVQFSLAVRGCLQLATCVGWISWIHPTQGSIPWCSLPPTQLDITPSTEHLHLWYQRSINHALTCPIGGFTLISHDLLANQLIKSAISHYRGKLSLLAAPVPRIIPGSLLHQVVFYWEKNSNRHFFMSGYSIHIMCTLKLDPRYVAYSYRHHEWEKYTNNK